MAQHARAQVVLAVLVWATLVPAALFVRRPPALLFLVLLGLIVLGVWARVRLSAGRQSMNEAVQALCFFAGANSVFYGEKLLTTGNPDVEADRSLFAKLGLRPLKC